MFKNLSKQQKFCPKKSDTCAKISHADLTRKYAVLSPEGDKFLHVRPKQCSQKISEPKLIQVHVLMVSRTLF